MCYLNQPNAPSSWARQNFAPMTLKRKKMLFAFFLTSHVSPVRYYSFYTKHHLAFVHVPLISIFGKPNITFLLTRPFLRLKSCKSLGSFILYNKTPVYLLIIFFLISLFTMNKY